eukprot:comp23605_c0_seq1/m.40123 comp23605_c0_seq1/g.40123  ORF comp23605_c0_seq1/g.40123 comp23605_c0_seq1/m.40123 type:complete len:427 (-) comp23605_c0_seq1:57-1337(-)
MAPPRRNTAQQDSSDEEEDIEDDETYEPINKHAPPITYNNLAEEITAAIRAAESAAAKATSLALSASMKPAFSFNPAMPPPLPPGPDGQPYNEHCARCHSLHLQNTKLGVNMQNFRAMYTNLHRDYMQLYSAHNELAEQNSTLVKTNAMLEEQAKHLKKVSEKEEAILNALRSFRKQRKLIRKEKGRRDRASQAQRVLTSFMEKALPDDVKIRQIDFTVEYKRDSGESVNDIYTLRDGKRTKIKNERESARILGLKEPGDMDAAQQARLQLLSGGDKSKKVAMMNASAVAAAQRPKKGPEGMMGAMGYANPNSLLLTYDQRARQAAAQQPQQMQAAAAQQRLAGAYGQMAYPQAMPALGQYQPGYPAHAPQAYAPHMQAYGQPTYDILPPLPMAQPPPQDGQQADALLRLSMQQRGLWPGQQQTYS